MLVGMRILRSHPVLAVHDLDRSSAWYEAVFGCTATTLIRGSGCFAVPASCTFMLGLCPDVVPASEIGDHSYVAYIEVDDVDAVHRVRSQRARKFGSLRPTSRGADAARAAVA